MLFSLPRFALFCSLPFALYQREPCKMEFIPGQTLDLHPTVLVFLAVGAFFLLLLRVFWPKNPNGQQAVLMRRIQQLQEEVQANQQENKQAIKQACQQVQHEILANQLKPRPPLEILQPNHLATQSPEAFRFQSSNTRPRLICHNCKGEGHYASDCPSPKKLNPRQPRTRPQPLLSTRPETTSPSNPGPTRNQRSEN